MQIWVIYGILLVSECCGTLGTAVNEVYFALFSMGAHVTGMTPSRPFYSGVIVKLGLPQSEKST